MTARVDLSNRPLTLVPKPRPGQPALHVATLTLVKADLIFGFLSTLLDNVRRIGGRQQLPVGHARAGFGNICTDENCKNGQCENEDAQRLIFPDL